jgi:hypothetical protein
MALRVARGLFRLWLVLSVLWIGGVGYGAGDHTSLDGCGWSCCFGCGESSQRAPG